MTSGPAEPAEALTVQTPEQARLLLDDGYTTLLSALLAGPLSAGEAAERTRLTLKQAHHRLTRLHAALQSPYWPLSLAPHQRSVLMRSYLLDLPNKKSWVILKVY